MYDTLDFAHSWRRAWQVQHFLTFSLLSHFALPLSAGRALLFLTRYHDAAVTQSCWGRFFSFLHAWRGLFMRALFGIKFSLMVEASLFLEIGRFRTLTHGFLTPIGHQRNWEAFRSINSHDLCFYAREEEQEKIFSFRPRCFSTTLPQLERIGWSIGGWNGTQSEAPQFTLSMFRDRMVLLRWEYAPMLLRHIVSWCWCMYL